MSTDRPARSRRAYLGAFAIVVGALLVLALGGAALTTAQGPRVTHVQLDPVAAATASGSRLIFTTSQSLREVDVSQVTITPAADFTVDTSGRTVGIRFSRPLWDDTEYRVRIEDVTGLGGGPTATVEESFTTPPAEVYVLRRALTGDKIVRTSLDGTAETVYSHPHIEDFRATTGHLVIETLDGDRPVLVTTRLDGSGERELTLPGDGTVANLQSADRGNLVGYTFTDASIGAGGSRESALYIASLNDPEAAPTAIEIAGGDARVDDWRFVPGTDSLLMLTYDGTLTLATADGSAPVALGTALAIDGIARGSTSAVVERLTERIAVDLATAKESALPPLDAALGSPGAVTPLADGGTLRVVSQLDGFTVRSTDVVLADAEGAAERVFGVPAGDLLLHTCVAPSGRYAAFLVAPNGVDNPYDGYRLPLPERLETHVVELDSGEEVSVLEGFDISWCQSAPRP
ncbi:hypothetical protein [Microbacterium sp.]|uniref:hypothetical protein n=1 Tax=Microbacterium sp. TaxID=51671 RepID=UPI0039E52047